MTCWTAPSRCTARSASARTHPWKAGIARRARHASTTVRTKSTAWWWRATFCGSSARAIPRRRAPPEPMLDTIPVRADERFDVARVAEFLRASGLEVGELEVEQFPAGQSNLTFLLRSGDWEAVLRRPPLGPVAPRAHDMAREFRILQCLHPSFRLAPRPYVLCEDVGVI